MRQNQFLYIIDAIAPFVLTRLFNNNQVINWSKIPFSLLERNGTIPDEWCDQIINRFNTYCSRVGELGYNALSIDDLAHLTFHVSYPYDLQRKIEHYRSLFESIFAIAAKNQLELFINTDAAFAPAGVSITSKTAIDSIAVLCEDLFKKFPVVKGVILRLGECDGVDVKGEIRSNLAFRKAAHVRTLIRELIKIFEQYKRLLIVRTWTVGVYEIGYLMWNPSTYDKIFGSIDSNNLMVSHKYGESDFFRYLSINPLIFHGEQCKIVEFQTRREYEGFGEFPSFIGYDYEQYRDELEKGNIAGVHVWCQTGGWSKFHRLTFMPGSSIWNEINTVVTIKLFLKKQFAEQAVIEYAKQRFPGKDPYLLVKIMKLSDLLIKQLWYLPEFSQLVLYFRRLRIPPLIWIFWDTIFINALLRLILQRFVPDRQKAIEAGYSMLPKIAIMKNYAEELGINSSDFDFQYATFELLAKVRQFLLSDWSPDLIDFLSNGIRDYINCYPCGFIVIRNISINYFEKRVLNPFFGIILRTHPQYRLMEQLFFHISLALARPLVRFLGRKRIPQFASERAMGIDALLK